MSVKIMSAVFESETLGPTERLIMLSLADHADDAGRCYPSIARLRQRTGLSERAVQSNIRSLQAAGYITIIPGAGQGGSNVYIVRPTPAADAPPQQMHPRRKCTTPPQEVRQTPAADAPKPSRTIIEPSEDIPARDPASILCDVASPRAVKSFLGYRRKIRKPVSEIAAERLAKILNQIASQGGSPDDALGLAEEKGWQSIKAEWYFKEICNEQSSIFSAANRQMARGSQHGGGKPLGGLVGAFVRSEAARGH